MLCHICDKEMQESIETYKYEESGLDDVYLKNICVLRCECGEVMPALYRVPELNSLIGEAIVNKPNRLNNKEIKFLRKNAGMKAKDVYKFFDTDKTTYSKWEHGKQNPSKANDLLLRLVYAQWKNYPKNKINKILKTGIRRLNPLKDKKPIYIPTNSNCFEHCSTTP